jgi:negative regulator of sigma E activity
MGKLFVGTAVAAVAAVVVAAVVVVTVPLFEAATTSSKRELTVGDLTDAMVKYPPMNGTVEDEEEFA